MVSPDNRPAICEGEDALTTVDKINSQSCQDIVKHGALDETIDNNKKNNSSSETNIPQSCDRSIVNGNISDKGDVLDKSNGVLG